MTASVQDRDGAKTTLLGAYLLALIRFVYADAGFAGMLVEWASRILKAVLHIVRKPQACKASPWFPDGGPWNGPWRG